MTITWLLWGWGGDEEDIKDGDAELVELVNQYMTPFPHEFEVVIVDDQYGCND